MSQAVLFFCVLLSLPDYEARAENGDIRLKTIPALADARPFSEPVRVVLEVLDSRAQPMSAGRLHIRLHAPAASRLFSTDFPGVQGTLLIDMTLPVAQGKVEWNYVFPIRGAYRLETEALDEKGVATKRVFELPIKESRQKILFLAGFVVVLFLFGFVAGRLFTRPRRED